MSTKITPSYIATNLIRSPYIFNVGHSSTGQTITTGTITTVDFDTIHFDPNSNFNTSTNIYTVPVSGYWYLHSQLLWAASSVFDAGEKTTLKVYINGVKSENYGVDIQIPDDNSAYTNYYTMKTNGIATLNAGDEITITIYQNTNVNQYTYSGGSANKYTCFSGALLTAI